MWLHQWCQRSTHTQHTTNRGVEPTNTVARERGSEKQHNPPSGLHGPSLGCCNNGLDGGISILPGKCRKGFSAQRLEPPQHACALVRPWPPRRELQLHSRSGGEGGCALTAYTVAPDCGRRSSRDTRSSGVRPAGSASKNATALASVSRCASLVLSMYVMTCLCSRPGNALNRTGTGSATAAPLPTAHTRYSAKFSMKQLVVAEEVAAAVRQQQRHPALCQPQQTSSPLLLPRTVGFTGLTGPPTARPPTCTHSALQPSLLFGQDDTRGCPSGCLSLLQQCEHLVLGDEPRRGVQALR